jgi:DNA-directed RNA polymerase II subunit RPB1
MSLIKNSSKNGSKNSSQIIGIQFSILSPDEIRKGSVAEITNRDTYINNKPVIGGLFDPRMGVLEPGLICPTDGLDYIFTPGYFGHINLARPVFYIQYLNTVIKILRCVCIKCSKLLISKEKYKQLLNLSADERWNQVFTFASKIKRCGEVTDDGCGCKQPNKIKKENLATLIADWDSVETSSEENNKISIKLTPEKVIKIFRRISDDNINFMGFSPLWSRPDWMVCQTLAIPPPAVRPSVKHDSQQRSEDDITHIIVNIIKANKTLQEKIEQNANGVVIDDWTTVLQYYVATLVDNKIPGVAAVAQRSGRPLKSIKERLNGKGGRVRGNLMGKRVDFSARSVITPDPQLSIRQLGIPLKIAKNLTKPVIVNKNNKNFLLKLVRNGADIYPGAKILEKKDGENISLRYVDKISIKLNLGDIVHRHMLDGDAILFNRQPTLHRLSMMCHIAKIMPEGDTFRMNVGDTKPYNADFDGDEMNLHMPQDEEAEVELINLAAIPTQIISPANNKSIIGIFQDSLLGCYTFTQSLVEYNAREAMNLLMSISTINLNKFPKDRNTISNFDILSQILPPISLKYKTKKYNDDENYSTSNNVLEIKNGKYLRGQIEKGVLGDGSKGLIQRIYNDYGNIPAADFIDNIQNIVTEYMKFNAYSVGISDLIADDETNDAIAKVINTKKISVNNLIDQTHLGIFENKSGKTNEVEFETQVNNILNKASLEAGKIGRSSLNRDNRFVIMVNAGSKGSELNIAQMVSCLGQQNVDGKRIPYGFENRTLPHYSKFDDSPDARGFIENSFITGLTPTELFFHAIGGRVGLIDTAVKTSQTGYISRRLIKALEDLMVHYDMTVRNNKNKIIQFKYGDDGFDPIKVENQVLPLVQMTVEDIYNHFQISSNKKDNILSIFTSSTQKLYTKQKSLLNSKIQKYIEYMTLEQKLIIDKVFKNIYNKQIHLPVAFTHIIENIAGQQELNENSLVDITPLDAYILIEDTFKHLESYTFIKPTELFKVLYYYYLCPKQLLIIKRFNKKALIYLLDTIVRMYKQAIVNPGEMVGIIAAQSIGEPTTQMTLNTFHFAGVASKSNVTRGVPRIEEILSLSENPKNPSCTIYLPKEIEHDQSAATNLINKLQHTKLRDIVRNVSICFDPDDLNTLIDDDIDVIQQYKEFSDLMDDCLENKQMDNKLKSKWILRMEMNEVEMVDKNITMNDVHFALKYAYQDTVFCIYSDYNSDKLIFRIRLNNISQKKRNTNVPVSLDQSDEIYILKNFQEELLNNLILRGIKKISNVLLRKITDSLDNTDGNYNKKEIWVLDTVGTNLLQILALNNIDVNNTVTNDIQEVYRVLGIEAARQSIYNELVEVIEFDSTYINYHHLSILCDRMTVNKTFTSVFRHGINNDDIGPIAKASFEETPEQFLKAARHAELDNMRGISANVMCGQEGYFGTSCFKILLDLDKVIQREEGEVYKAENINDLIEKEFDIIDPNDPCSINKINQQTNVRNIKQVDLGISDDYDPFA